MTTNTDDKPTKDPAAVKRRALKLVGHASTKAVEAETQRAAAWAYAARSGASSREIADADGDVSHTKVAQTIARLVDS